MYREIFEGHAYAHHGITLDDGACVFDVGANIGMFTLYAAAMCRRPRVYAFEPIPAAAECLRLNAEIHGVDARVFPCGLASQPGRQKLVYYPNVSILSGRLAGGGDEEEAVRAFLRSEQGRKETAGLSEAEVDELLRQRMTTEEIDCAFRTLSQVIREERIERIDLLKVDVEKSELDVLLGLEPDDWPKIGQIVAEVHDLEGQLQRVVGLLESHGFRVQIDQDALLAGSKLYDVYATRPDANRSSVRPPASVIPHPPSLPTPAPTG
jgi:FkbM family methyltransferase